MRRMVVTFAFALFATACATSVDGPTSATEAPLTKHGVARLMPVHGAMHTTSTAAPHLVYNGGPVIESVKIYSVYWGSEVRFGDHLDSFYRTITQSSYFDWLREYNAGGHRIGRGSFGGSYTIQPSSSTTHLDDSDIQAELAAQMEKGAIPSSDGARTLFMIHFPPGVRISMGGATSCVEFCAYHSAFYAGKNYVFYGVHPDQDNEGCDVGCGDGATSEDNVTAVASHEMIEAVTDPAVGNELAWYDDQAGEIGDICVGQTAEVAGFLVQRQWSNNKRACIAQ